MNSSRRGEGEEEEAAVYLLCGTLLLFRSSFGGSMRDARLFAASTLCFLTTAAPAAPPPFGRMAMHHYSVYIKYKRLYNDVTLCIKTVTKSLWIFISRYCFELRLQSVLQFLTICKQILMSLRLVKNWCRYDDVIQLYANVDKLGHHSGLKIWVIQKYQSFIEPIS